MLGIPGADGWPHLEGCACEEVVCEEVDGVGRWGPGISGVYLAWTVAAGHDAVLFPSGRALPARSEL